jgi:hypothetical protein
MSARTFWDGGKQTRYGAAQAKGMTPAGEYIAADDATMYEGTTTMLTCRNLRVSRLVLHHENRGRQHPGPLQPLIARLQKELPRLGSRRSTPLDNRRRSSALSPRKRNEGSGGKLDKAFPKRIVSISRWQKTNERASPRT